MQGKSKTKIGKYIKRQEVSEHQLSQQRKNQQLRNRSQSMVPQSILQSKKNHGRWTPQQKAQFQKQFPKYRYYDGKKFRYNYKQIAKHIPTRTVTQVRSHAQKYEIKLQRIQLKRLQALMVKELNQITDNRRITRSIWIWYENGKRNKQKNQSNELSSKIPPPLPFNISNYSNFRPYQPDNAPSNSTNNQGNIRSQRQIQPQVHGLISRTSTSKKQRKPKKQQKKNPQTKKIMKKRRKFSVKRKR